MEHRLKTKKAQLLLWLSDARGIYIPRDFAKSFVDRSCVAGVSDEDWAILEAGPDHEFYWETWTEVEEKATYTDAQSGVVYTIWNDGDCWLVPVGMLWSEEADTFVWPKEAS